MKHELNTDQKELFVDLSVFNPCFIRGYLGFLQTETPPIVSWQDLIHFRLFSAWRRTSVASGQFGLRCKAVFNWLISSSICFRSLARRARLKWISGSSGSISSALFSHDSASSKRLSRSVMPPSILTSGRLFGRSL